MSAYEDSKWRKARKEALDGLAIGFDGYIKASESGEDTGPAMNLIMAASNLLDATQRNS